jgi:hypothetical protein
MDNVGLKIRRLGTSNSMVTQTFSFLGVNRSDRGQVQQPIIDLTRPCDDFMVLTTPK